MAGNADNVQMGTCTVEFGAADLGYTSGGVTVTYTAETTEKIVDQEDAPLDEVITKQGIECVVPLAEYSLARFKDLLPGATLVTDGTDPTKVKLSISGAAGQSLGSLGKKLIIKPVDGDASDWVTITKAVPQPKLSFKYDKNNVRVYEVTFKGMKTSGQPLYVFGDETATA